MCKKNNDSEENVDTYLGKNETDNLFVKDASNCVKKDDVTILFLLESPHTSEVENKYPLMGDSGKSVSKFLLGDDSKPFGDLVKNKDYKIMQMCIAIVNVSNMPLQNVNNKGRQQDEKLIAKLETIRTGDKLNEILVNKLKGKLKEYTGLKQIILCGNFAKKYFDEAIKQNSEILFKIYKDEITVLAVPHPSRGQWEFIEKHKDDLDKLKCIFK